MIIVNMAYKLITYIPVLIRSLKSSSVEHN